MTRLAKIALLILLWVPCSVFGQNARDQQVTVEATQSQTPNAQAKQSAVESVSTQVPASQSKQLAVEATQTNSSASAKAAQLVVEVVRLTKVPNIPRHSGGFIQ